jgi:hypothetical protein
LLRWLTTQTTLVVKNKNMAFTINSPFHMDNKKCSQMREQASKLQKQIADIKAKAAKENKIGNWDDKSDQLSRLNERIATNCK